MSDAAANLPTPFLVAGVDEVGRGPLAGPVVAAAVVLDPARPVAGLNDSKSLSESARDRLDIDIRGKAAAWCIAEASVAEIDELNILQASMLAMQRAVYGVMVGLAALDEPAASCLQIGGHLAGDDHDYPELVLVDGNRSPGFNVPSAAIVKGDGRVLCIGAASIIAKVWRDRFMAEQDALFPGYGFAGHKGYGTAAHQRAIDELGVTPLHRRSFAPVKRALANR